MVDQSEIRDAKLSVQRALLGEVTSELRAVSVKVEGTTIALTTTFDGDYDEGLWETASCVGTYVIADYPTPWTISEVIRFRRYPDEAHEPDDGELVFLRREV